MTTEQLDLISEFEVYVKNIQDAELPTINKMIKDTLPVEPEHLKLREQDIIGWLERAQEILAVLTSYYDRARFVFSPAKDYGSDKEKLIYINAQTYKFREVKETFASKVDALRNKMFSCKAGLSSYRP